MCIKRQGQVLQCKHFTPFCGDHIWKIDLNLIGGLAQLRRAELHLMANAFAKDAADPERDLSGCVQICGARPGGTRRRAESCAF